MLVMILAVVLVEAHMTMVSTIVLALVALVVMRLAEVEVSYVIVHPIDTEQPFAGSGIDRAIEIVHVHETAVLRCRKNPAHRKGVRKPERQAFYRDQRQHRNI